MIQWYIYIGFSLGLLAVAGMWLSEENNPSRERPEFWQVFALATLMTLFWPVIIIMFIVGGIKDLYGKFDI